jgi:hypothetical protein
MRFEKMVSAIIIAGAIIVLGVLSLQRVDQYLKNHAVISCMSTTSNIWKNDNNETKTPHFEWFQTCLKKQGYN